MTEDGSKTRVDRIWRLLKNNRLIAGLIVAGAIVIAIGQLTSSLSEILTFLNRWSNSEPVTTVSKPNVHSVKNAGSSPCAGNGETAAILAYAMASSDPDSLPEFVEENAMLFASDGNATKCLSLLTLHLRRGATSLVKAYKNYLEQLKANKPLGATGEPRHDPAIDMRTLANKLQSLTTTLPLVALGDSSAYNKSGIVASTQKWWALVDADPILHAKLQLLVKHLNTQLMGELIAALPQDGKQGE